MAGVVDVLETVLVMSFTFRPRLLMQGSWGEVRWTCSIRAALLARNKGYLDGCTAGPTHVPIVLRYVPPPPLLSGLGVMGVRAQPYTPADPVAAATILLVS